ncbi:MAG: sulfur carrier protein ThiS adenylyltransferase ThiF [Planctomycetota bacterium]|jgi:sulfur carrier protein ThiS adenylyltransferase
MVSSHEKLEQAVVGIAGLGGLGSTVAVALARAGVGRLIIADFDTVEQDNLSRQQYFIEQVGKNKVDCVTENLQRINPGVEVRSHQQRLDADNISEVFAGADVIAECFDAAEEKRMIVETVLCRMDRPIVVTVSGLAGYGNSNAIQTRRISERLILVGDGENGIDSGKILTAARVGVAACHQANAIIEVLIDEVKR